MCVVPAATAPVDVDLTAESRRGGRRTEECYSQLVAKTSATAPPGWGDGM